MSDINVPAPTASTNTLFISPPLSIVAWSTWYVAVYRIDSPGPIVAGDTVVEGPTKSEVKSLGLILFLSVNVSVNVKLSTVTSPVFVIVILNVITSPLST